MQSLRPYKHSFLLVMLIAALLLQPVLGAVGEVVAFVSMLAIFLVVFETHIERLVAATIGIAATAVNIVTLLPAVEPPLARLMYHVLALAFISFAVVTILFNIFRNQRIGIDHVMGAVSGYILAGLVWANVYYIFHLFDPECFRTAPEIAWNLTDERMRRFLFNYMSFATLTAVGYGDITPLTPTVRTLAWLEAMFGQFYLAIYIGQLVGLKLAEREIRRKRAAE